MSFVRKFLTPQDFTHSSPQPRRGSRQSRILALVIAAAAMGIGVPARADVYVSPNLLWNWPAVPGTSTVLTHTFSLPAIADIGEISLEMAHTWGNDLRPVRLDGPNGASFVLLNNTLASNGLGNFDLGQVGGSGAPANLALYRFTEAGPSEWIWGFSPAGEYNAVSWTDGPIDAGQWTLTVHDSVTGGEGAVGHLRINFSAAVPEPGFVPLLAGMFALARRRRRAKS